IDFFDGINSGEFIKLKLNLYSRLGEVFLGIVDNKMIGAGGIYKVGSNTGCVWIILSKQANKHLKELIKIIKEKFEEMKFKYRHLEAFCVDNIKTTKFLEILGFKRKKEYPKYSNGRDFVLYNKELV
ncbi:MAG: hypothetical protein NC818_07370, partial [Candidatus Omnitrophica bacterium]|nr:hypothetical protein [Candidatus Omnitrophota bacterium]